MAIDVEITGPAKGNGIVKAEMYNPRIDGRSGESSLVVYTLNREQPMPKVLPFINDSYGNAMNQNGAFGGTPIDVHNGIDSALWTGSNITGAKVTFNSTDTGTGWPPAGTNSVKIDNPAAGDVWQFAKGSDQDLTSYTAFSMEVYIDKDWTAGDSVSIYGWDVAGGVIVGAKVLLEDYIDETNFDVAQSVAIPLVDFGLTGQTISAFRMQQETKAGKAAKFYIDTLAIQETGGGIEFRVTHDPSTRYYVNRLTISISDALAGVLANGAGMIPLSYDQILGVGTLSNGIILRSVINGEASFSASLTSISDFLSVGFEIKNALSDGTNTFITLEQEFPDPLIIKGANNLNFLSMTVSDDLTGLLKFSALLRGSEVEIL